MRTDQHWCSQVLGYNASGVTGDDTFDATDIVSISGEGGVRHFAANVLVPPGTAIFPPTLPSM